MITQDDFNFISAYDSSDSKGRIRLLTDRYQAAKTFLNILTHVSKDQTIQYVLILIDDMLQV